MPPPSLSSSTIASRRPSRRGGEQAADVVGERDVADQQHDGPARGGGDAEGGRDRAVDPVGAAVGEHARRRVAGREERLDVADRHRGGDDERRRRAAGARRARRRRAARTARRPSAAAIAPAAARSARAPVLEPLAAACAASPSARERHARVGGDDRRHRAGGVLPGGLGVEARPAARRRAPCSHWRSGLDVGRSPTRRTRSGAWAAAQPGSRSSAS